MKTILFTTHLFIMKNRLEPPLCTAAQYCTTTKIFFEIVVVRCMHFSYFNTKAFYELIFGIWHGPFEFNFSQQSFFHSFQTTSSFSYCSPSLEIVYVVVVVVVIVIVIVTHFNFCKQKSMNLRQIEVVAIAQAVAQSFDKPFALAVAQTVPQVVA